MTLFLFRAILIVHEKKSCTPKFKVYVFNTYTATYSTVLALFALFCLTSHHGFEQTAEKCIIFAPSTNESAQGASQEASITTKGGHNRRQAPVIY